MYEVAYNIERAASIYAQSKASRFFLHRSNRLTGQRGIQTPTDELTLTDLPLRTETTQIRFQDAEALLLLPLSAALLLEFRRFNKPASQLPDLQTPGALRPNQRKLGQLKKLVE